MPDVEYPVAKSGFDTQDIFRSINVSFQPYLPFTQRYSMSLQQAGGSEMNSILPMLDRLNYARLAPPPAEKKDRTPSDSSYPFSLRRSLFGGDAGKATGKITAIARNKDRIKGILDAVPPVGQEQSSLAEQLHQILSADYGGQAAQGSVTSQNQSRQTHEVDLGMFSRSLDENMTQGGFQGRSVQRGSMRDNADMVFTKGNIGDFDMDLSQYQSLNSYISSIYGNNYDDSIDKLEISYDASKKDFAKVGDTEDMSESQRLNAVLTKANRDIDEYNAHIRRNYGEVLGRPGVSRELTGMENVADPGRLFELGRETGVEGTGPTSAGPDYMVRQIMGRFALNQMRPFYSQSPLSRSSMAIVIFRPTLDGNIPQISPMVLSDIVVIDGATTMKQALATFQAGLAGSDDQLVISLAADSVIRASNQGVSAEHNLMTTNRYLNARTQILANGALQVTVDRADGDSSVHKVRMEIANRIMTDLRAHYNDPSVQNAFSSWYNRMMQASNRLTKTWYNKAMNVVGMRKKPISAEWRDATSWRNENGYKKKHLGVWSGQGISTWKNHIGQNFSVSPYFEMRRRMTSGRIAQEYV